MEDAEKNQHSSSPATMSSNAVSASSLEEKAVDTSSLEQTPQGVELVDFDRPNDAECPYEWSPARKWMLTAVMVLGTFLYTLNGTAITVGSHEISQEFSIQDTDTFTNSYWYIYSWNMGGAIYVPLGMPTLEEIGIRPVYLACSLMCFFMVVGQAVAKNVQTLIITRFFSGGCVALLANAISSSIPDMFEGERATSMPVEWYILMYVLGTCSGPPIFAGLVEATGNWRWVPYLQLILYGTFGILIFFVVKETRHHVILRRKAQETQKKTGRTTTTARDHFATDKPIIRLLKAQIRPYQLLLTEPLLLAVSIWSAFAFGNVFIFTQSVEYVYTTTYNFTPIQCGYIQVAISIGVILGFLVNAVGLPIYLNSAQRNTESPGTPIPEARLYLTVPASFIGMTGGMFLYGWGAQPHIHWIVPTIGMCLVAVGILIVVAAVANYITDAYAPGSFAGSAISAAASLEFIFGGNLPLATQAMYNKLGVQWASSLLGFISLVLSFVPVMMLLYGKTLRERSPANRKEKVDL